jgi:DNA-binding MarR family transcriptional regulator
MQFDLQEFLPYRLSLLANTVSQGIARHYRDRYGISVTEWRILAVLGRYPGLTASEVAARTAMDKVPISRGVKSLMDRGLLERKTDANDRRRRQLFLTASKGQQVLRGVIPKALAFEGKLLDVLEPQEAELFLRLMERLRRKAELLRS